MNKIYTFLMIACLQLAAVQLFAQKRYLQPIYASTDIEVSSDVTYGTNIDFLTSNFADQMQVGIDVTAIKTALATGQSIDAKFFDPADAGSKVKVKDLKMDIYKAKASVDNSTNRPIFIFLHTGNFLPPPVNGSPSGVKTDSSAIVICTEMARRGYVAVSVSYRLGWNPLAASVFERRGQLLNAVYRAIHDTKKAVRYLRDDAAVGNMYGVDGGKVVVYGEGTGAYVALALATLDKHAEMELPKFTNPVSGKSFIDTLTVGNIDGFGGLLNLYPPSTTSSKVSVIVNAGGALADTSWLEAGDVPMICFHSIRDPFAPFEEGTVIVPTTNEDVVEVQGGNLFIKKAVALGNNNAFKDMPNVDPYTMAARKTYGKTYDYIYTAPLDKITVSTEVEGLYPIIRPLGSSLLTNEASPWQFWDPNSPLATAVVGQSGGNPVTAHMNSLSSNPGMGSTKGRTYIDTIMGYMCPRVSIVLGFYTSQNVSVQKLTAINGELTPNPANDFVTVKFSANEKVKEVVLTSITGKTVASEVSISGNSARVNTSELSNGIYFIRAYSENGVWSGKFVKN